MHCVEVIICVVEPNSSQMLIFNVKIKRHDKVEAADEGNYANDLHPKDLLRAQTDPNGVNICLIHLLCLALLAVRVRLVRDE